MCSALSRATRGKGIIISSGAKDAFELRGPHDVINIAVMFGLNKQQAKVSHVQLRRLTDLHRIMEAQPAWRPAFSGKVMP